MRSTKEKLDEQHALFLKGLSKCTTCNVVKDLSEFYANPKRPNGVKTRCKRCILDQNATYVKKNTINQERIKAKAELFEKGLSVCSICKKTKKLEMFGGDGKNTNGVRSACLSCERHRARYKWQAAKFTKV